MKARFISLFLFFVLGLGWPLAWADHSLQFPENATFTTKAITPFAIEGLTGDATGNLYTTGRQPDTTKKCPVWRINPSGTRVTVGFIQNNPACNPSGITFDGIGNLYIADAASGGIVWKVSPDPSGCASDDSTNPACASIPAATAFASGVPGTNGLAFDREGNLWTGDGTTGLGRVWKIGSAGGDCTTATLSNCIEVFRIQPMRNSTALGGDIAGDGVGRQVRTFPPGTLTNTLGGQDLAANGLAFESTGRRLFVGLRNSADASVGNNHILEFPASPFISGNTLCTSNSDGDRRDNSPRSAGEINGGAGAARGKISCMDQELTTQGLPLPIP